MRPLSPTLCWPETPNELERSHNEGADSFVERARASAMRR